MAWNVMALTASLDSAFGSLQHVTRKIQEMLMTSQGQTEKQLIYVVENIKSLRPINACGYFEITKSTLTSMFSVRYFVIKIKSNINYF